MSGRDPINFGFATVLVGLLIVLAVLVVLEFQ